MQDKLLAHGEDLIKFFKDQNSLINSSNWVLIRTKTQNDQVRIKGILVTGKLSNNTIGVCIEKDCNIIICLEQVDFIKTNNRIKEAISTLYKYDIYVFQLGVNWIFNTPLGQNLLAKLFEGSNRLLSKINLQINHTFIGFTKFAVLEGILQRFQSKIFWLPNNQSNLNEMIIENILLIENVYTLSDIPIIIQNQPSVIISTAITSKTLNMILDHMIPVIWINLEEIYNEIARDFVYYIGRRFSAKTVFHSKKNRM